MINKDEVLFLALGLIIGLIIGYWVSAGMTHIWYSCDNCIPLKVCEIIINQSVVSP